MNRRYWVYALALMLRVGYGWHRAPQSSALPDMDGYVGLAVSVADSWSLSEDGQLSAHREPVYPVLLGLCFKVFGANYWTILGLNCALGILGLWLLVQIGRRLFDDPTAFLAALIAAVYPQFIYYAAQSLRETLMAAMGLLSVYILLIAWERAKTWMFSAAGAVHALGALTNTTFLPFGLVLAPGALMVLGRSKPRKTALWACVYLASFLLLYSLWPLRNYRAFGSFILGSTAGAAGTFYAYLIVPEEIGGTPQQTEIMSRDPVNLQAASLDSIARERFYWKKSLEWVSRHPWNYAGLVLKRFWNLWRLWPRPRAYDHSYRMIRWVSIVTDGWIIPLGFLGIALTRLRPAQVLWIYLLVFSVNGLHAMIFTMIRYRFSLMPWMILFAAVSLERFRKKWITVQ